MRPAITATLALLALPLLSGCGSDLSSYSTPAELRADLIAAGFPCAELEDMPSPGESVKWASFCRNDSLELKLIIYPDQASLRDSIEHVCSNSTTTFGAYGKDWIVVGFPERVDSLAKDLGGKTC